ncbi:MAG: hypothetical protein IKF52_01445 [Clostridia bacterium]|nr:hypothetical protein [Clostridia bacterium]MBR3152192.1 hypothetical protein [Clostridia bacterium]MBR3152271.1 hypothetical protein [Clostridia bacterium]
MRSVIRITATKEEIKITINVEGEMPQILEELEAKMPRLKKYYNKEKTPIHIIGKVLKEKEKDEIRKLIAKSIDVRVSFGETSELLGLHAIKKTYESEIDTSETKFIQGSLRSGQREEFTGSIVILGDLNYGAEVIAGENIVVLGTLRGLAHAGANGNKKAIISANSIDCIQVRIANIVKEIEPTEVKFPFIYLNENDNIVVE